MNAIDGVMYGLTAIVCADKRMAYRAKIAERIAAKISAG